MTAKSLYAALALLLAVPFAGHSQGTDNDMTHDFGARFSAEADKRLAKGLHLSVEGEARLYDNLSDFGRLQLGTGVSYKINRIFKVGAGYMFIEKKNSADKWKPRHRVYADASASLRSGDWRFSLKERLQLTHRDVGNHYQKTPNSLALKSRFKVEYKGIKHITPYAYAELRNVFNDPGCDAVWSTSSESYSGYSFPGYNDAYVNRLRGSLGAEWKITKQHSLDFFVLADRTKDKNIDTNASGTRLKSLTWDRSFNGAVGVAYKFAF